MAFGNGNLHLCKDLKLMILNKMSKTGRQYRKTSKNAAGLVYNSSCKWENISGEGVAND